VTTHRDRFFRFMRGELPSERLFFPDISDWFSARRTRPGEAMRFGCGQYIADDDPFNKVNVAVPDEFRDWTYLDFYRRFDWGLPVHIYYWFDTVYDGVRRETSTEGGTMTITLKTPHGELRKVRRLAEGGTWATTEEFVRNVDDLRLMRYVVEASEPRPRYDIIRRVLDGIGEMGVCDIYIPRSPMGKLVQEYMGFEGTVYAMHERPDAIADFLALQEAYDMRVVELAANAPARIVYLADHADENLISPPMYATYCIPFYEKMCTVLHQAGKLVSTHLDGNFRGFFPLLADTHMDYLDGCTPAPMSNYEPEELAAALPEGMHAHCGVPATLFTQGLPDEEILAFGERILDASDRFILTVGDLLPGPGDVRQVIKLGEMVKRRNAAG